MAEGTYESECMRAELLGIEKPNYEEFMKNKQEQEAAAREEIDIENLKDVDLENEGYGRIGGKLDELNNILKSTHKKINRFRASCGSLTNMLKFKLSNSNAGSSESLASTSAAENVQSTNGVATNISNENGENFNKPNENSSNNGSQEVATDRKTDLSRALDKNVDCLDSLIEKAENAEYTMRYQRNQMQRFLK